MMRTAWTSTTNQTDRSWERWLLIAAVVLLLSACRGLDTRVANIEQPPSIDSQELRIPSAPAPEPVVLALAEQTPAAPQRPTGRSLSDYNTSDYKTSSTPLPPPIRDARVVPAQHTSPVPPGADNASTPDTTTAPAAPSTPPPTAVIPDSSAPDATAPDATAPQRVQSIVQVTPAHTRTGPPVYPQPCFPQRQQCGPEPWCADGVPRGGWRPPGLPCPWPEDEYLCDGGDKIPSVRVRQDWSVDGLEPEDTVVHYDTLDGDTHVEPSNRVCLYAPRFASVRKVYGIIQHDHWNHVAKVNQPVPIEGLGDVQIATTSVQPVQPILNLGTAMPSSFRERTPPIGLENRQGLVGLQGNVLPYEDITDLQRELLTNTEKARLADLIQAAAVWSHDAAVQVVIDNITTHEEVVTTAAESVHIYSLKGKSRLRVCKLASREEARPGETVEFTLQFENVGDQTIGNVTVIDNLTTRLEYVEDSQTSSLQANFSSSENQGESLTLRWEIVAPIKVGEGGVIRFTCRVR